MFRKFFIFIWVVLLFTFGCEEPVDLDLKQEEEKIVVISEFAPDGPFEVVVSKSKGILSNGTSEESSYVLDAEVQILQDGQIIEELVLTREEVGNSNRKQLLYYRGQEPIRKRSGTHEVRVNVPEYKTLTSFDAIPQTAVSISAFSKLNFNESSSQLDLGLRFDHIDPEAHYHLLLTEILKVPSAEEDMNLYPLDFTIVGNAPKYLAHFGSGVLIKGEDLLIGTTKLNIRTRLLLFPDLHQELVAELRTVSENYFDYHSSLSLQTQQQDSILAKPVILFNNIENGLGNFAAYNYDQNTIMID